tara:strand:- start:1190 stop:2221 length:1032 start_codon:yes stop_codon:yes gene_type:complete
MKPQFQHEITTSFSLWMDNYLLKKGDAFKNYTNTLSYLNDSRIDNSLKSFSSPHKQWVFDKSISNATVPSSVTIDGVTHPKGGGVDPSTLSAWNSTGTYKIGDIIEFQNQAWILREPVSINDAAPDVNSKWEDITWTSTSQAGDTLFIDYINGRIVTSLGSSVSSVEASYAVKDFNLYVTNETEENLIIESKFDVNSRFKQDSTPIPPYDQVLPAIFINNERNVNDPFSLGGEDKTMTDIRCVVMAENMFQLDAVLSIFNDSVREVFTALAFEDYPLNEFGDAFNFDYKKLIQHRLNTNPSALHYIDRVDVSKLSDRITKKIDSNTFVGFIDFEVVTYRYPRI